jgi:hypothetical protein
MEARAYYSVREVTEMICNNHLLVLTALDETLSLLPTGNWIGGIAAAHEPEYNAAGEPLLIHVNDLTPWVRTAHINSYQSFNFESIEKDTFPIGFSIVVVPAFSSVHLNFGIYLATLPSKLERTIVGWVAGSACGKEQMRESIVVDGSTGEFYPERVVAMHCALYDCYRAWYDIINPFVPDTTLPHFKFQRASFSVSDCTVLEEDASEEQRLEDIKKNIPEIHTNFKRYLEEKELSLGLHTPLLTTLCGERVTTSLLMESEGKSAIFSSPVLPGLSYYIGRINARVQDLIALHADTTVLAVQCYSTEPSSLGETSIVSYGQVAQYLYNLVVIRLHISKAVQTVFEG